MTRDQYLVALEKLGLAPHALATCEALGLERRQLARLANGTTPISRTLEKLLRMYLRFGVPKGI